MVRRAHHALSLSKGETGNHTGLPLQFEHATIVTMNAQKEILQDGQVLIQDGRIASVGLAQSSKADQVIDCRGKIIIPALVSSHSHLTGLLQRGL